jgi:hypothetical protein
MIGLVLRLGLAWQDHRIQLSEWLSSDDAYLSLSVARNLAWGRGMTSDGTHPTNGFQPLYVFAMVPVYLLVPRDELILPVHIAGTLLAVAGTAAAGVWYLLARRVFARPAALCVLFFFTISHYFVATDVNGLETALYGLMLSLTLYYYVTRILRTSAAHESSSAAPSDSPPFPVYRACAVFGLLAGLTVLARVDAVILVGSLVVHYLWQWARAGAPALRRGGVGAAAFLATLAPWLTANWALCGTVVPDSGPAVRFLAIQNGWKPVANLIGYTGPQRFTEDTIPWQYYANSALHLAAQTIAFLPLTAHAQGMPDNASLPKRMDHMPIGRVFARAPGVFLALIGVVMVLALVGPLLWRRRRRSAAAGAPPAGDAWTALLFLRYPILVWFAAYAFYLLCPWYSHRYLYPVLSLLTLGSGALLHVLFVGVLGRRPGLRAGVLALGALLYSFLFFTHTEHYYTAYRSPGLPDRYTPVLPWVTAHVPADAVVGSFQTGVLSYFLPQRCVNLDGVVNAAALRAMRAHELWAYVRQEKVDYIVDWPICIDGLLRNFAGVAPLPLTDVYDEYSMHVYRVDEGP